MEEKTALQLVRASERGEGMTDAQLAQLMTYEPSLNGSGRSISDPGLNCERVAKALARARLDKMLRRKVQTK